jgi:hypothetical protein
MRLATIVILFAAALSFVGCASESYEEENYRRDVEQEQAAQRLDNFVHSPP